MQDLFSLHLPVSSSNGLRKKNIFLGKTKKQITLRKEDKKQECEEKDTFC